MNLLNITRAPARDRLIWGKSMATKHYVIQTTDPSIATTAIAVKEITEAGFVTTWLATLETYTDQRRKTRTIKASLFPGYLFVEFDVGDPSWKRIASCRGVLKILGSSPLRPTALPAGAFDRLRLQFEAGEFRPKPETDFSIDEPLTVTAGPFSGHIGVCRLSKGERVKILLKLFGHERTLTLRRDMVRRAVS